MSRDRSSSGGSRAASSARARLLRGGCSCRRIIPPLQLALQAADQGVFRLKQRVLALQNLKRSLLGLHLRFERGFLGLHLLFERGIFRLKRGVFDPDQ